ncbi:hypothetical protein Leryth_026495 [Lithospermum erythrorhizon]|nr:hypothetical protein Leryth_026495 [Lithospermum erythrorhizon]
MKTNAASKLRNGSPLEDKSDLEMDLREEYANAFRTESYNLFWGRILALSTRADSPKPVGSTTAARLSSYRLFVDHLLDPDQPTVTSILKLKQFTRPDYHALFIDYFSQTADASLLCSLLLKDVDNMRVKHKSLKGTLNMLQSTQHSKITHLPLISSQLTELCKSFNPFTKSASFPIRFKIVQTSCSELLKRLESCRDKTRAKLHLISKFKRGSAIFLVALTASLTAIVATHALAILLAAPAMIAASFELASATKLARLYAQLDVAAKGTYILIRDLDTISRLVERLNDELEHMHAIVLLWLDRGEDGLQASGEVTRHLKVNDMSFTEQLDELEEHLYLCFMTINRARNLVIKEIVQPPPTSLQSY